MRTAKYIVLERIVCQRTPKVCENEFSYLSFTQLTQLLANSRRSWNDIEMVYQLCERRQYAEGRKKGKEFEVVGIYLQGKNGQMDFKYMEGLSFLVPVPNVLKELVQFMNGGWNNEC